MNSEKVRSIGKYDEADWDSLGSTVTPSPGGVAAKEALARGVLETSWQVEQ